MRTITTAEYEHHKADLFDFLVAVEKIVIQAINHNESLHPAVRTTLWRGTRIHIETIKTNLDMRMTRNRGEGKSYFSRLKIACRVQLRSFGRLHWTQICQAYQLEMVDVVRLLRLNDYCVTQGVSINSEDLYTMVRAYERTMQKQASHKNLKSFIKELVKQGKMKGSV